MRRGIAQGRGTPLLLAVLLCLLSPWVRADQVVAPTGETLTFDPPQGLCYVDPGSDARQQRVYRALQDDFGDVRGTMLAVWVDCHSLELIRDGQAVVGPHALISLAVLRVGETGTHFPGSSSGDGAAQPLPLSDGSLLEDAAEPQRMVLRSLDARVPPGPDPAKDLPIIRRLTPLGPQPPQPDLVFVGVEADVDLGSLGGEQVVLIAGLGIVRGLAVQVLAEKEQDGDGGTEALLDLVEPLALSLGR